MAVATKTLDVKGMSCGHCVSAIESSVNELKGIETVNVDLSSNKVTVSYNESEVQIDKVKEAIEEAGYDVA
ncbi:copper chaperone CopZ [Aquibacillus sp. 3ASR75-11]|uniref:Copper chaperone CopZ n=1 Tax=Terrihalobacillus insolitus TaxID=2950438 RepID=A0A9X4ALJ3_9BACI|nr:copper chaperone CopZ [Terrihalobacillus insolitus]MDC3412689.1 copper chaperone CopZ [Terrihalobacillus insolitus]MDC3423834.1 copper chaperone CopZ [Terrihalobacillus insolitus]